MALGVWRPRNWWGSGVSGELLLQIAVEDGIPLAWVPPMEIVREIVTFATPEDRVAFLLRHEVEIVEHCGQVLSDCHDPWLEQVQPLAVSVVNAWQAGVRPAAMGLAVNLGEDLAIDVSKGSRGFRSEEAAEAWEEEFGKIHSEYSKARYESDSTNPHVIHSFLNTVVRAPIPHFFVPWRKASGDPTPKQLSRHVAVHRPTVDHYTDGNALLSVMLVCSLMRELQDKYVNLRADEDFGDV